MDISLIIVSYNTKQLLDDCLASIYQSLKSSSISFEVIVVDNVSTDGTREMLQKKYSKVVTIFNATNVGFGKGNNQGIRKAKGAYTVLINSDTVVQGEAIEKLYTFGKSHPNDFAGPKLLNVDGSPQTSCGPFFSLPVVFAALFLKGDLNGMTRWSPEVTRQVDWVSGACIIAATDVFRNHLLFDEKIFMYMEEIDLFMRARAAGHRTYFYHEAQITHFGSGSSTNKRTGPVLNIYKGLLYVYNKHYSFPERLLLRVLLKVKACVAMFAGLVSGNEYLKKTYAEAYQLV